MSNIWVNSYSDNNSDKMSSNYYDDKFYKEQDEQNKYDNYDDEDGDDNGDYDGDDGNILCDVLRLKLRKPKHWKWELFTSKSTSNAELPRILLYDHHGKLLVDTKDNTDEKVYKEDDLNNVGNAQTRHKSDLWFHHESLKTMKSKFDDLNIETYEPLPSDISSCNSSRSYGSRNIRSDSYKRSRSRSQSTISSRGLHLKITTIDNGLDPYSQIPIFLPTPPPTISTTPTTSTASSSSGPRAKRRVRRSHSSHHSSSIHSDSILERLSCRRISTSSSSSNPTEYADEDSKPASRYFLRSSKAGTLIVKEDSFQLHSQRRRRKYLRRTPSEISVERFNNNLSADNKLADPNANVANIKRTNILQSRESLITEEELDEDCT